MKKWFITAALIAFIAWQLINKPSPGAEVDAEELLEMLATDAEVVLLDVREPDEYAAGHIPGSILIPLGDLDRSERLKEIDPSQKIVVICRSGNRSEFGQQMLMDMGFTDVYNLTGGIQRWTGPIEVE